jgi:hypothetical protein
MPYLPQFKNDLFISYRHAANETHDRWVDSFCEALRASLVELVGDVTMWRDEAELRSGDRWRPEIAEALNGAAIFLAIISRTYLDSDECRKELDQFLERLKDGAEGPERRIVPIFKQPPKPEQDLPRELGEVQRHEFFRWDPPGSPRFRELGPNPNGPDTRDFWETLGRLAQDIMVALEDLHGKARKRALGVVFVARVSPEMEQERERLRSDLQQRGYIVVPEREYLWNADDLRDRLDRDLEAAQLCIHLVARTESIEPKASERAKLQLELAHQAMKRKGRPAPLVWIQPAAAIHPSARALIDYIEGDLANEGVEYWRGGLEDLKTQIYDKLPPAAPPKPAVQVRETALLVEERDIGGLGALKALLVDGMAIDPQPVKFDGSSPKDNARFQRTLAACDQCLVFWSGQSEEWVRDVLDTPDLAGHLGRDRTCIYVAGPPTPEKATFQTTKARTIQAVDALNEPELRAFFGARAAAT